MTAQGDPVDSCPVHLGHRPAPLATAPLVASPPSLIGAWRLRHHLGGVTDAHGGDSVGDRTTSPSPVSPLVVVGEHGVHRGEGSPARCAGPAPVRSRSQSSGTAGGGCTVISQGWGLTRAARYDCAMCLFIILLLLGPQAV